MKPDINIIKEGLGKGGLWLLVMGILQITLGFFALFTPQYAGMAASVALGLILVFASMFELAAAWGAPSWRWGILRFLSSIVAGLAGLVFIFHPSLGLESITLFVLIYFILDGIDRLVMGFWLAGIPGRGWMLLGGLLSIVLGVFLFRDWSATSQWMIGILIGVNLMFSGWAKVFIGIAARSFRKVLPD